MAVIDEGAHPGGDLLAALVEHMHRQRRRTEGGQHDLQLAPGDGVRDLIGQHLRVAPAHARRVDRRLVGAHHQTRVRRHRRGAFGAVEMQLGEQRAGGGHDRLSALQIARMGWPPDAIEKGRRGADHRTDLAHLEGMEAAFGELSDADRDIHRFVGQVHQAVDQQRVDRHLAMGGEVLGDQRNQEQFAEHHRRGDRQVSADAQAAAGGQFLRFLDFQKDAPAVLHIAPAGFGQPQAAGIARQQQGAEAFLQGGDGTGRARRRHAQQPGAAGEALRLGHRQQHLHFLEPVHHHPRVDIDRKAETMSSRSKCPLSISATAGGMSACGPSRERRAPPSPAIPARWVFPASARATPAARCSRRVPEA